jgi:hypothetical protein
MKMNTRTRTTITLLTGLVTGLALAPSALAVTGCTNSYLNGNYAMQFSGLSAPGVAAGIGGVAVPATLAASYLAAPMSGDGAVAPIAGNARLIFDGNGNVSGYSSENMAGQWTQGNVTGAYTVNTDCTFSVALTDAKGNTENFGGVLVAQSNSALVMQTDAGTGVTGALKSTRGLCQTSDLFGSYGLQYSGTSLAMSAPYSSVGLITFDGQGNVTTAETRYNAGTSSQV